MTTENRAIDSGEKYYTPQTSGKESPHDPQTIVRQFRGRPRAIEYGCDETRHKHKRKFLLISESALRRWIEEHSKSNH
jgi:hypothetical protein